MRPPRLTLRRSCWLLCAWVLLLPRLAAAEPNLTIDLDGDGHRDRVTLDHRAPSILEVWLSGTGTTQVIRSRVPLLDVVVADLDGDHRPELIARDSDSQLHVWERTRKRFHSYRPRVVVLFPLGHPNWRALDEAETEPPGEITSKPYSPLALALCASPRAPALGGATAHALHAPRVFRSLTALDPFAPRPPPAPPTL